MMKNGSLIGLTLTLTSLSSAGVALDRFYCRANVSCTFEGGCRTGDIPWEINIRKQDNVWLVTHEPEGDTPEVYTEYFSRRESDDALFLENVGQQYDGARMVRILTILADMRMIASWHTDALLLNNNEHTVLGACVAEE